MRSIVLFVAVLSADAAETVSVAVGDAAVTGMAADLGRLGWVERARGVITGIWPVVGLSGPVDAAGSVMQAMPGGWSVGLLVIGGRKRIGLKGMDVPWGGVKVSGRLLLAG